MRCVRGRVRQKRTTSATSSRGHHPGQNVGRAAVALLEGEVRRDAARADVGAPDSVLAQLVIECAGQADLAELRGAVDGFSRKATPAGLRGDGDEVTLTARNEMRDRRARRIDRALEVDVDHLLEVLERRVHERVVRADAGVRDADVEAPEALDGLGDRVLDLPDLPHVAREPERVGEPQVVSASRSETDRDALVRQCPGDRSSDPATRARDERDLALELHACSSTPRIAGYSAR